MINVKNLVLRTSTSLQSFVKLANDQYTTLGEYCASYRYRQVQSGGTNTNIIEHSFEN